MKPIHLGHNDDGEEIALNQKDRQVHMHVVGASGTGKSKFLELLIRHDLHNPDTGACVIDPHGKLIDDILSYVSHAQPQLAKRIVLFEPASQTENIIGFNPIPRDGGSIEFILQTLISNCLRAWGQDDPDKYPRIRTWLYNIFYPIIINNLTIVDSAPLINIHDKQHRKTLVSRIDNQVVRGDWEVFESSSNLQKQTLLEGAANRLRRFLRTEEMRLVFSQQSSALDIADIMKNKKILLVNLRGNNRIHQEDLSLLGIMLLGENFRVGMLRDERNLRLPPFHLYIDEFGQYVTQSVADMLDQIRKKKVFVTLAHQHLAQLENEKVGRQILNSVTTNCRLKVAFGGLNTFDARAMTELIWTGKLDFHEVHSTQYTTKVRTHEETREILTESTSSTESDSRTRGSGSSDAMSTGTSRTASSGGSRSSSHSKGGGITDTSTKTDGTSHQTTKSNSTSRAQGSSEGTSWGNSKSESSGEAQNTSANSGHSIQHRVNHDGTVTPIDTYSNTSSSNSGLSSSSGLSASSGGNSGSFNSTSEQSGNAYSDGTSSSVSKGISGSKNYSNSSSGGSQWSNSHSHQQSKTHTDSKTKSKTKGESFGESESIAIIPYDRKEEYLEGKDRYWTLPEQLHRKQGALMNLNNAQALFKQGNHDPQTVNIKHVKSIKWIERTSPIRLAQTKQRILQYNSTYYTTRIEAERESEARQVAFFQEPLRFKEIEVEYHVEDDDTDPKDGGIFNI